MFKKRLTININQTKQHFLNHKKKYVVGFVLFVAYYFCLPKTLFNKPYATVIESHDAHLLGAKIASDGQWRFPMADSVTHKFETCILLFEDQHFYQHPGFNPVSLYHAAVENIKAQKIVRGGSTITQQVIRLSRDAPKRSFFEKIIELIQATRLEWRHSKKEILQLYASHAPFGGNVVGVEMASWRYFGVPSHQLSWAESATLAVLPNAPSLIHLGKNRPLLIEKRNRLLARLFENQKIDSTTYQLSLLEDLPNQPFDLPQIAPHFLEFNAKNQGEKKLKTTLDFGLQNRLNELSSQYYNQLKQNEIYNLCILVVDAETRNVLGYVGNAPTDITHQKNVDIIHAPRSTGSILKPFLYAAMLDEGLLLPELLVPDIPTQIGGFSPQNFNLSFDGAVPAKRALARSLNIPAVLMLKDFGIPKFHEQLQKYQLKDIDQSPKHYGLSLILGGAESNIWELTQAYAAWVSTLNYYQNSGGFYRTQEMAKLNYIAQNQVDFGTQTSQKNWVGAGAIYSTFESMKEVNRPEGDEAWQFYDSSIEIAWKTGTSFGNRDAWAIGMNSKYIVSVWMGNATGEGRPNLTGVSTAAPLLFDIFRLLPQKPWFQKPVNDMENISICSKSGGLPTENCPIKQQWVPLAHRESLICPYHTTIHVDASETFRVNSDCEAVDQIKTVSWFVLPPVMEWFYKRKNASYKPLPPFRTDCLEQNTKNMDFIYPKNNAKIIIAKDFYGNPQPVIAKVAHHKSNVELFWYLNQTFLGKTTHFHEMSIIEKTGKHQITVVDQDGFEIIRTIEIQND